jgi:hypothetical protein
MYENSLMRIPSTSKKRNPDPSLKNGAESEKPNE